MEAAKCGINDKFNATHRAVILGARPRHRVSEGKTLDESLDNVGKLRRAYQLWNDTRGGSAQYWLELMTDDVSMQSVTAGAPGMDFTKKNDGKAEAEKYFAGLAADWEMIHFTSKDFIAQGDRVVVLSNVAFRHRKTGKVAESPKADVFRFRDGQIVEFFEFFDTARALAATRED
jgi:ketosteroid isomerase-like protein